MVVKKGMNDHQVLPMAAYFKEQGITLRFIEFMDVGSTNGWNFDQVVTKRELIEMIHKMDPLEPAEAHYFGEVAKRYRYVGTNVEVGFITSVSESFCVSLYEGENFGRWKVLYVLICDRGFGCKRTS